MTIETNIEHVDDEIKKEFNQFNLIINTKLVNKEIAELYMQRIVNFYDNNPKFDYL